MRFVTRATARARLEGKTVAVVGSGPGVLENAPGAIDSAQVVLRVNNYKLSPAAGFRCDVFFSFFGTSIRKTKEELIRDGVTLCMSKVPNAHAIESEWHRRNGKMIGVDFRPHYDRRDRMGFWFCDTYVPTVPEFMEAFDLLGCRMPTTGFAAIYEVLLAKPRAVFLTGFDFFSSGIHNVDEPWRHKNPDDPFRHAPERELAWLAENHRKYPVEMDMALQRALAKSS